jgi:GNAT superfamily N-acetyltransferase
VITVRPAEDTDIQAMAAIRAREWETEAYWLRRIGAYLRWEYSPEQAQTARGVFVAADDGGNIAGFVAGHRTRRYGCDGELEWINVIPERRGEGIADHLIVRMGEWFVEQGLARICVDVDPGNVVARKLYARFGAAPFKPYWMVWEDSRRMCGLAE